MKKIRPKIKIGMKVKDKLGQIWLVVESPKDRNFLCLYREESGYGFLGDGSDLEIINQEKE